MFPTRNYYIKQEVEIPVMAKDKSNLSDFFKVDVAGNHAIPFNYGGWPRSDLAQLNALSDMQVAKAFASHLVELPDDTVYNAGLSDEAIILQAKSKYVQSPAEMTRYIEGQLEFRDAQLAAVQRSKAAQAAAAASKKEIDDLKDSLTPEEREEIRAESRKNQIKKLVKK